MTTTETLFTSITADTAFAARDRVLDDLNALTDGKADKAIKYVSEFIELEEICNKFRERERLAKKSYEDMQLKKSS